MADFILQWKDVFIYAFLVLLSIVQVVIVIVKKPVKTIDTLKEIICAIVPKAINIAEKGVSFDKNSDKKSIARRLVLTYLREQGYDDEIILQHTSFVDDFIELVLSTPQKKEGGN